MLCYAVRVLSKTISGEPPTYEAQMMALSSVLEILCQYLSIEELASIGLACKRTYDIVAAEHRVRCKDFSRGQESAAIKVIWYGIFQQKACSSLVLHPSLVSLSVH